MKELVNGYTTPGTRIIASFLGQTVTQTVDVHGIGSDEKDFIGMSECLSACLVSFRKEEDASISVSMSCPSIKRRYTALCEKDGRVRGCADDITPGVIKEGVILEVTQRLAVRGDYTSVVTADNIDGAVEEYFRISQQTRAKCVTKRLENGYACIIAEMFPITDEEHRYYEDDADKIFGELEYLKNNSSTSDYIISYLDEYTKTSSVSLSFGCTCTKRSVVNALAEIAPEEIDAMRDKNGYIEVKCKHCGKTYRIGDNV